MAKSPKVNASEAYLQHLCRRTFLSLWSHPNLFRDQGQVGSGDGKEICDLLVVFGDRVIVFSDKHCQFPETAEFGVAWPRWYRRAVAESIGQVRGAERWLRRFPDRVFVDRKCSRPLPLALPQNAKWYRVAVASGAGAACAQFFGTTRGSLMIHSAGDYPIGPQQATPSPFTLDLTPSDPSAIVHVLDEHSLETLLKELDTAGDFIDYLEAKERLILSGRALIAAGEEELLAVYLRHRHLGPEKVFSQFEEFTGISLDVGFWDALLQDPQFIAKKHADAISYVWDRVIEEFTSAAVSTEAQADREERERILRLMAAQNRFERRVLAKEMVDIAEHPAAKKGPVFRTIMPGRDDTIFVFGAMPSFAGESLAQYRERRVFFIGAYANVIGLKYPKKSRVLGLATEPLPSHSGRSHDAVLIDNTIQSDARFEEAKAVQEELGFGNESRMRKFNLKSQEYPKLPKKSPWHLPCVCGSGRPYRQCCGKRK